MKKLFFLLTIICIGCTSEQSLSPQQTKTFEQAIKHMHNENALKVRWIEHSNRDNGYNKDTIVFMKAAALTTKGYDALNKKSMPDDYYNVLVEHYNTIDYKDTASLNRAKVSLENFNQTKDSISYYICMLNLMKLEYDILEFYCAQVGANRTGFFTALYKDKDTIRVSEPYIFVVTPAGYKYRYSEIIVDSTPEVTLDNKKITVPVQTKKIGGTLTFTLTPTQKGRYFIKGKVFVKQKQSGYSAEQSYFDSFVVK